MSNFDVYTIPGSPAARAVKTAPINAGNRRSGDSKTVDGINRFFATQHNP